MGEQARHLLSPPLTSSHLLSPPLTSKAAACSRACASHACAFIPRRGVACAPPLASLLLAALAACSAAPSARQREWGRAPLLPQPPTPTPTPTRHSQRQTRPAWNSTAPLVAAVPPPPLCPSCVEA
eukprot:784861-Rhodomonas_salina.1